MSKPNFEPHVDGNFRIVHTPLYHSYALVIRKISSGEINGNDAISKLKDILSKYPYHFEATYVLSELYGSGGDFEKACNCRYRAAQKIVDLLPDDDDQPISLDWDYRDNEPLGQILLGSAIDHFLICDFEMAAGFLETLLDLDEEDRFGATKSLAYCYIALKEQELFESALFDIDDKDVEKYILQLWASVVFSDAIDKSLLSEFKQKHPSVYAEFISDNHDINDEYLEDIDSERPSAESRARLLWLQTEHLWSEYPDFIVNLKS